MANRIWPQPITNKLQDIFVGESMETNDYANCTMLLKLIGHQVRLAILDSLKDGEKCVNDVCQQLNTAQPNVSRHLSVLRAA